MNCEIVRQKLLARLDCEIDAKINTAPTTPDAEFEKHLSECAACRREYRLLSFTRAAALTEPSVTAPAWFYQRLRRRIYDEAQGRAVRQVVWKLAFRMIPALSGITLILALIFVWQQARPLTTTPQNFDYVFIADDVAQRMLAGGQKDITYESVLAALAERHGNAD